MDNNTSMREKVKAFLNGLTNEEIHLFWRFLRSKVWTEWVETRLRHLNVE